MIGVTNTVYSLFKRITIWCVVIQHDSFNRASITQYTVLKVIDVVCITECQLRQPTIAIFVPPYFFIYISFIPRNLGKTVLYNVSRCTHAILENDWSDKTINDESYKKWDKAYEYALDMTIKEIYQAVEGMYHNLNY